VSSACTLPQARGATSFQNWQKLGVAFSAKQAYNINRANGSLKQQGKAK
jgi:hypothetical protein